MEKLNSLSELASISLVIEQQNNVKLRKATEDNRKKEAAIKAEARAKKAQSKLPIKQAKAEFKAWLATQEKGDTAFK